MKKAGRTVEFSDIVEQPLKMPACSPQQTLEVKCDNSFKLLLKELPFINKSMHSTKSNEAEGTIDFLPRAARSKNRPNPNTALQKSRLIQIRKQGQKTIDFEMKKSSVKVYCNFQFAFLTIRVRGAGATWASGVDAPPALV